MASKRNNVIANHIIYLRVIGFDCCGNVLLELLMMYVVGHSLKIYRYGSGYKANPPTLHLHCFGEFKSLGCHIYVFRQPSYWSNVLVHFRITQSLGRRFEGEALMICLVWYMYWLFVWFGLGCYGEEVARENKEVARERERERERQRETESANECDEP